MNDNFKLFFDYIKSLRFWRRIFGYGFNETTDLFHPPLTVINQDPREMGHQAVALLFDMIDNKITGKPENIIIKVEFLRKKYLLINDRSKIQ
jgi:DNA-binding LacI/PurR family transcriptional regulator